MKLNFYKPTFLKIHPPISGITAHATMPGRFEQSVISFLRHFLIQTNVAGKIVSSVGSLNSTKPSRKQRNVCLIIIRYYNQLQMLSGECVVVDNHRVLHGRRSYSLKPGGSRLLEGGYLDWDEVR